MKQKFQKQFFCQFTGGRISHHSLYFIMRPSYKVLAICSLLSRKIQVGMWYVNPNSFCRVSIANCSYLYSSKSFLNLGTNTLLVIRVLPEVRLLVSKKMRINLISARVNVSLWTYYIIQTPNYFFPLSGLNPSKYQVVDFKFLLLSFPEMGIVKLHIKYLF